MKSALIAFIATVAGGAIYAQGIGADDLLGAAADGGGDPAQTVPSEGVTASPDGSAMAGGGGGQEGSGETEGPTMADDLVDGAGRGGEKGDNTAGEAGPGSEGAGGGPSPDGTGAGDEEVSPGDAGKQGSGAAGGDKDEGTGARAPAKDVENFVAFVYSPGPRDPFISPNAPSTIVQESPEGEDITLESLMAFAEKLKGDLGERIRVVGVSVPPSGANPYALVIYASGKGSKGGADIVEALPPRTVSVETGLPVRYPEEETLFISKLAQLVAQSSPIRLKRDSRIGAVIFPIQTIDDRGVLVSLPGYDEPILLPVYRDIDPRTESDN